MKLYKIFSHIQNTLWYRSFLDPVISEIGSQGELLDIGTGSGKLLQVLIQKKGLNCIGVDTNKEMIEEAKLKLKNSNAQLLQTNPNESLPYRNNRFDYITICSVLFLLDKESIDFILNDAVRMLAKNGKIIVLTPTGNGGFWTLSKNYLSLKNLSIYLWFYATRNRAGPWTKNKYLNQYAVNLDMCYKSQIVMHGLAQLEVLK